jgi:hypothetical protein
MPTLLISVWGSVGNLGLRKIAICSNAVVQQCYSCYLQYFLLSSVSQKNSDLFKFCWAIVICSNAVLQQCYNCYLTVLFCFSLGGGGSNGSVSAMLSTCYILQENSDLFKFC